LSARFQALSSLERDQRPSGTRAQNSVNLAHVEPFLLQEHLRLPNLIATQTHWTTGRGAGGLMVLPRLVLLLIQLNLALLHLSLALLHLSLAWLRLVRLRLPLCRGASLALSRTLAGARAILWAGLALRDARLLQVVLRVSSYLRSLFLLASFGLLFLSSAWGLASRLA
jgi:hypothetical protein